MSSVTIAVKVWVFPHNLQPSTIVCGLADITVNRVGEGDCILKPLVAHIKAGDLDLILAALHHEIIRFVCISHNWE